MLLSQAVSAEDMPNLTLNDFKSFFGITPCFTKIEDVYHRIIDAKKFDEAKDYNVIYFDLNVDGKHEFTVTHDRNGLIYHLGSKNHSGLEKKFKKIFGLMPNDLVSLFGEPIDKRISPKIEGLERFFLRYNLPEKLQICFAGNWKITNDEQKIGVDWVTIASFPSNDGGCQPGS